MRSCAPIREFSDEELRADLAAGLKPKQIAEKRGVSRQAVYQRINRLGLTTAAASTAPVESARFVNLQLVEIERLNQYLQRVELLMLACDEWLRDPTDPTRYDVGARSEEIQVTYTEPGSEIDDEGNPISVKGKASLAELLLRVQKAGVFIQKAETRHADIRELILRTVSEARQVITTAADLAQRIADARSMEAFREATLAEISKVSPEVASKIAEAVRRSFVLRGVLGGPPGIPAR